MTIDYEIELVAPDYANERRAQLKISISREQDIIVFTPTNILITAIARKNKEILGICDLSQDENDGYVFALVDQKYQHNWIGIRLLERIIIESKKLDLLYLHATVLKGETSEHILRRLGFIEEPISEEDLALYNNIPYTDYRLLL